ncbi:MAG: ribosomal protein S18-alanine N-acetyltransferase [Deltaproteobacteria bacterium]|nr:ribosomal protein S18-alanine N-acetyltransferase [Deltaproteobacteria bacterium]
MPGHNMDLKIEPLRLTDLDEVMRIERLSFPNPWTRGMFENELKNPVSFAFAARAGGERQGPGGIIAYSIFWIVQGEAHILNLAVDPEWRRKGVALTFLQSILDFMRPRTVFEVFLEVRMSNIAAIRLYKGLGFREAYVRKKYYGDEDAIVMKLEM